MMVCADAYLSLRFDERKFNCWDFVRKVWLDLTEEDLGELTPPPAGNSSDAPSWLTNARARELNAAARRAASGPAFVRILRPEAPCLALAMRPRWAPHVGVLMRERVLHLTELGARYESPADFSRGFPELAYYRPVMGAING